MIEPKSVAIFGGAFDPIHMGHVRLVEEIQKNFAFEPLVIVPSRNPPHKPPFQFEAKDRLEMAQVALAHIPNLEFSTFEMDRKQTSYSVHTIRHFLENYPKQTLYFIMGSDAFYGLPEWYEFPDVLEACSYIVVTRKGFENSQLEDAILELKSEDLLKEIKDTKPAGAIKRTFRTKTGTYVHFCPLDLPEVSSTEIRLRLQLGEQAQGLVPSAILGHLARIL
jgi:nicotinate-nucleotide adenylyltransferase